MWSEGPQDHPVPTVVLECSGRAHCRHLMGGGGRRPTGRGQKARAASPAAPAAVPERPSARLLTPFHAPVRTAAPAPAPAPPAPIPKLPAPGRGTLGPESGGLGLFSCRVWLPSSCCQLMVTLVTVAMTAAAAVCTVFFRVLGQVTSLRTP